MRRLRIAAIGLAVLLVLLLATAAFLLGTTPGARLVLGRVLPDGVGIGATHGRLWGPLVLEDVRYRGPAAEARIGRLRADWRATRFLLHRVVEVTALEVDSLDARLLPSPGREPAAAGPVSLPLPVRLDDVVARSLRVVTVNGDTARAARVALAAGGRDQTFDLDSLRLRDFEYRGHRFQADAGGRIVTGAAAGAAGADSTGLDVAWVGTLADGRRLAGRGMVRGTAGSLSVDHRLTAPFPVETRGAIRDPWQPDSARWTATVRVPRLALAELREGLAGEAELRADASGDLRSVVARVAIQGAYPGLGPIAVDADGTFADGAITLDSLRLRRLVGPGAIRGTARMAFSDSGPSVDARLAWTGLGWPLDTAAIASPSGALHATGRLADFRADLDLALRRPASGPLGRWTVRARGGLAEGRLRLPEVVARSGSGARLTLVADLGLPGGPRGSATLRWTDLAWPAAAGDSVRMASPDGSLELRGGREDFTIRGDASLSGPAVPATRLAVNARGRATEDAVEARVGLTGRAEGWPAVALDGRGSYRFADGALVLDTVEARLPEAAGTLAGHARAGLGDPARPVEARLRWRDLGWPLESPRYRSEDGGATLVARDGTLRVSAEVGLGGETLPVGRWRLEGQGTRDRFVVDSLRGRVLGGEIRVAGVIRPDSGPAWDLRVTGDTLDPGQWRTGWDGRLGFRVRTDGRVSPDGPTFRVVMDSVFGALRGRDVAGRVRATGGGSGVRVDTLWLRSGGSTVAASGGVGDTLDLVWRVSAEALGDFAPGITGTLDARGRLAGPRAMPSLALRADGRGVAFGSWGADRVVAAADVEDGGRRASTVALTLTGVRGPTLALDSLRVTGSGTREDHSLAVAARAAGDTFDGALAGGLVDGEWSGSLQRLRLRSAAAGDWRLRSPSRLAVGPDSGAVEELCWVGSGELCLGADWDATGARWHASGRALPMAFFRPALPRALALNGEFGLETRGRTGAGPVPQGMLRLTAGGGTLDYRPEAGRPVTQPYDSMAVDATSDSTRIDARARLDFGTLGAANVTAAVRGAGALADRELSGRVRLHVEDDSTVSRFVPGIAESHGTADIEVSLAGSPSAPRATGSVAVRNAGGVVTAGRVRLADGTLDARSTENGRWQLDGGIASEGRRLTFTGEARPPGPDSAWQAALRLDADSFPAWQTPEIRVVASPRLRARLTADSVLIGGQVTVPRARVVIRSLEAAVPQSPDVVIVGAGEEAPADSAVTPAALRAQVDLVLGDSVTVNALGLSGRIDGRLGVLAPPQRPLVGSGELAIHDGRYRIYRQTFAIDRGRLLYAGSPLANPGLDLRVTRSRGQITAGMDITGRARSPRVQLFSDPTMGDDEILAYLIVGQPLRGLTRSQGSQVQDMARSIGVAGGNLLLARISSTFGLETARLQRTTTVEGERTRRETSLVLGRQILPRVHVDYAIGLTGAANVLRFRYRINDLWTLQTESGEETGADLLYTFGQ